MLQNSPNKIYIVASVHVTNIRICIMTYNTFPDMIS